MFYYLFDFTKNFWNSIGFFAYEEVMFRCILAALTSLFVAILSGPKIIRWLMKKKIGDLPEFNHAKLNDLNKEKTNTPTMGGLIILLAIIIGTVFWARMNNPYIQKALFLIVWFGLLGAVDDWLKLTAKSHHRTRDGLKPWEKLIFQFGGAVLIAAFLYSDFSQVKDASMFWLPFYKHGIPINATVFVIIAILYISATSNAVNITDGMDGLATGCIAIMAFVLIILCYIASENMEVTSGRTWSSYLLIPHINQASELSIFFSAIFGASIGFLWYNCHPAQTFMGDVGSLPLGAAMGYGALVTRNEILLLIIGGVFVLELGSVILQVSYYKYTGGKKIFKCAPVHHHFHLDGWSEPQIVVRFWLLAVAFAAIALATLKIR